MRVTPIDHTLPPEVRAHALAKYSRSAAPFEENLATVTAARSGRFLDRFYHEYGHASIADMADVAVTIEDISLLAAMHVVDEPLWDGQERSTRYQDFSEPRYLVPLPVKAGGHEPAYRAAVEGLFAAYRRLTDECITALVNFHGCDSEAQLRSIKARAFDCARALLPLGTLTSLGQIMHARAMAGQIARLQLLPYHELGQIAHALHDAGLEVAPTLLKHARAADYDRRLLTLRNTLAERFLPRPPERPRPDVVLAPRAPLEEELLATFLYSGAQGQSYGQCLKAARVHRTALLNLLLDGRGEHDPFPRVARAGYELTFDITIDAGAYRDLNRHRRAVRVPQPVFQQSVFPRLWVERCLGPAATSFPFDLTYIGTALTAAEAFAARMGALGSPEGAYALPLGAEVRVLLKCDLAEAAYIIELRSKPGGHPSYRRIAYQMYLALANRYPEVAARIRAVPPELDDIFQRR